MSNKFYQQVDGHFITKAFVDSIHSVSLGQDDPTVTVVTMEGGGKLGFPDITPKEFVDEILSLKRYKGDRKKKRDKDDD